MADDHASAPRAKFDVKTDEALSAYVAALHERHGIPERLRYPATDEEYDRMTREALAELDRGESSTLEEVRAHFADRIAAARRG